MHRSAIATAFVIAALGSLTLATSASATIINVNTQDDEYGTNIDNCSLREAVQAASTNGDYFGCPAGQTTEDEIRLLAFGYQLTRANPVGTNPSPDDNQEGDLDLSGPTKIVGIDSSFVITHSIEANDIDRIIEFDGGGGTDPHLRLEDLVLTEGNAASGDGAATDAVNAGDGGAVLVSSPNDDALAVEDVQFIANHAPSDGGAIKLTHNASISDSVFRDNTADGDGGGIELHGSPFGGVTLQRNAWIGNDAGSDGGAISVYDNDGTEAIGPFIQSSTLSGNTAAGRGGAVLFESNSALPGDGAIFRFVTVVGNSAGAGNAAVQVARADGDVDSIGAIYSENSPVNCLIANPSGLDGSDNIDSGATCGLTTGNLPNTDPVLAPLSTASGGTWVHRLYVGSPAINLVDMFCIPTFDQLHVDRSTEPCDAGAVEGAIAKPVNPPVVPAGPTGLRAAALKKCAKIKNKKKKKRCKRRARKLPV
jgi:CSLREA domain-containing protein